MSVDALNKYFIVYCNNLLQFYWLQFIVAETGTCCTFRFRCVFVRFDSGACTVFKAICCTVGSKSYRDHQRECCYF